MYTNNIEQFINFFYFIITGVLVSFIFDLFRITRRTFKTSDFITNIEDIIFGIITTLIIIISIFKFNNGELRLYIFLGIAIGICIYMLFISKFFIKINVHIINYVKKIIIFITKPIIYILKLLKNVLFRPISIIVINLKGLLYKITIKVPKRYKKL